MDRISGVVGGVVDEYGWNNYNSNELEFAVFCVENVAAKLGIGAEKVYKAFTDKSNILKDYIIPEYEILHTQSKEYIVDDIIELMQERGVIG